MNITPFQAIYPKVDLITSPESFFGSMKYQFNEFYKSGFFDKSSQEALYIYQIENSVNGESSLGIMCCTDVDDLSGNKMLKHEKTLAAKEQQMMRLILQRQAYIKPVLLTYPDVAPLNKLIEEKVEQNKAIIEIPFKKEKEIHRLWKLSEGAEIEEIKNLFKTKVPKSYIADGHHRCSTTEILYSSKELENAQQKFGQIFTVYFPLSHLTIWDFNRVVEVLDSIDTASFIVALSKYCKIKKLGSGRKPKSKFEMTMHLKNGWFALRWKKKLLAKYKEESILLDSKLFNEIILKEICGIGNVRENQKISYHSGKSGIGVLEEEVKKSSKKVAFCIFPVLKDELMHIADKLETLPPKSTYFEPRMKNGVLSKEF